MTPTTRSPAPGQPPGHHVVRARAVSLAVALAVALWAVATQLLGMEVRSPEMGGDPAADLTLLHVTGASLVASVAAWGLLAILERFTRRARTAWLTTSTVALALSLGAPLTGAGITGANRAVLALLHLAVGGVLLAGLARTTAAGPDSSRTPSSTESEGASR